MNEAFGDEAVFEALPVVHSMGTMLFDLAQGLEIFCKCFDCFSSCVLGRL